jgi:arylsulfatase A-like enzyme
LKTKLIQSKILLKVFYLITYLSLCYCKMEEIIEPIDQKIVNFWDLTRELKSAEVLNFNFDEKLHLTYHWKKNQGRYSGLIKENRWLNTQITFLKNQNYFQNSSKDSILLTPNSKIKFKEIFGDTILKFQSGILSKNKYNIKGGRLRIFNGDAIELEIEYDKTNEETWSYLEKKINLNNQLAFEWISEESYLFLGSPILVPSNSKYNGYNIIFIVVDSLRKDSLGCYGLPFSTSPNIDSLCEESILFKNHFSNANWTKPSMISMFYGEYASNLGITNTGFSIYPNEKEIFYNLEIKNMINVLREQGYYTSSIMNNVFLLDYTGVGVDLGFHELNQIGKDIIDTEKITEETLHFLETHEYAPFFLHINYNTPHGSYSPPMKVMEELKINSPKEFSSVHPIIQRYYGEVKYTDDQIGLILNKLKKLNLYDNSLIILTADHGDLFDEKHTFSSNGVYGSRWGHGETHYDEEINIPLIMKPPSTIKSLIKTREIKSQSSSVSIFPTMLSFLGVNYQNENFRGKNYFNEIIGNEKIHENFIYTEGRLSESYRTENFKYIRRYPGFTNYLLGGQIPPKEKLEELYNLVTDPKEHTNISQINSVLLREARELRLKNRLIKNSFYLYFPPNILGYSGTMQLPGGIYDIEWNGEGSHLVGNRFHINVSIEKNKTAMLRVMTNEPELNLAINFKSGFYPLNFLSGAWGIPLDNNSIKNKRLLYSREKPKKLEELNRPWIYTDLKLSGNMNNKENPIMAEEVKSILKSWGYIHE